ncbi:hypothetical protein [Aestuariivirga sp.]|uniref:hypothetical protein n=1 Tax=Aestuariivirga sp. TaxID=2650926 RepID=UPI003BA9C72F
MLKRTMLAMAAAAAMAVMSFAAEPAEARVNVYLGVPYYGYQVAPHWRYYNGRGWYDPYAYSNVQPGKLSCGQARRLVKDRGYYNISAVDCVGKIYTFWAFRNGKRFYVSVNSWTGAVWKS